MKKSDLVVGRTYSNGRGRKRKLVARDYSGKYRSWERQSDQDCVEYIVVDDGTKKNLTRGERRTMTATAFAAWAKREVVEEE